jgi:hypothetical protein
MLCVRKKRQTEARCSLIYCLVFANIFFNSTLSYQLSIVENLIMKYGSSVYPDAISLSNSFVTY